DFYIENWAHGVKDFGKTVFIRLGHEMNDPYRYPWGSQNNKAEDFVSAWRHVVDKFNEIGATNVVWVWSPHPAYLLYQYYYPGDEYIDWLGVSTYGPFQRGDKYNDLRPEDLLEKAHKKFTEISKNKPYAVLEFGVTEL
ncbi:MAG: hypothetical protein L3J56_09700, partial [Bacteroidales bacterium]|nr:hypothetical protein [Bacteroidales bacterium]